MTTSPGRLRETGRSSPAARLPASGTGAALHELDRPRLRSSAGGRTATQPRRSGNRGFGAAAPWQRPQPAPQGRRGPGRNQKRWFPSVSHRRPGASSGGRPRPDPLRSARPGGGRLRAPGNRARPARGGRSLAGYRGRGPGSHLGRDPAGHGVRDGLAGGGLSNGQAGGTGCGTATTSPCRQTQPTGIGPGFQRRLARRECRPPATIPDGSRPGGHCIRAGAQLPARSVATGHSPGRAQGQGNAVLSGQQRRRCHARAIAPQIQGGAPPPESRDLAVSDQVAAAST
jgi:hypothetical protein